MLTKTINSGNIIENKRFEQKGYKKNTKKVKICWHKVWIVVEYTYNFDLLCNEMVILLKIIISLPNKSLLNNIPKDLGIFRLCLCTIGGLTLMLGG